MAARGRLLPVATGSLRSTSAGRHYGVYWSSRMQSGGQYECNCLVSWNAIRWSSQCNFADSLMGGIIHHCQDIHDTLFSRAIKYKVHRPDLVGGPRAVQRLSICNRDLLALTPSHLQAGFGIQTFHPLVVDYCGFLSNESLARHEPYA